MDKNEKKFEKPVERFEILTDESLMPGNGVHKGKRMKDVPADYLLWCRENARASKSVNAYISDNYDALLKQAGRKPQGSMLRTRAVRPSNRQLGK